MLKVPKSIQRKGVSQSFLTLVRNRRLVVSMDLAPLPLPSQEYSCVCPPTYRVFNVQFTCFLKCTIQRIFINLQIFQFHNVYIASQKISIPQALWCQPKQQLCFTKFVLSGYLHVSRVVCCGVLCIWHLSLNRMFWEFICVVVYICISFSVIKQQSLVWIYHVFLIHSLGGDHLDYFHVLGFFF